MYALLNLIKPGYKMRIAPHYIIIWPVDMRSLTSFGSFEALQVILWISLFFLDHEGT